MPSLQDIKEQLKDNVNWVTVAYKKNVYRGLQGILTDNETLINILDGLYTSRNITGKGMGESGVLCLTDKRLFFVTNELRKPVHEEIPLQDISDISYSKSFSSITIRVKIANRKIEFKTFSKEASVQDLLDSIKRVSSGSPSVKKEDSYDVLENVTDLFIDKTSGRGFQNKIKTMTDDLTKLQDDTLHIVKDMDNLNLLFTEAKKITHTIISILEQAGDINLKDSIINDIVILTSLCTMVDEEMSDEELLMVSLVMMPLNPGSSKQTADTIRDIYSFDTFPMHYHNELINYWDDISGFLKNTSIDTGQGALLSLQGVRSYDKENSTNLGDRYATMLYTYCQVLMKADGTLKKSEEERLAEVRALIYSKEGDIKETAVQTSDEEPEETLEEVMEKINSLVGMIKIKEEIKTFVNLIKVQKERNERGLPVTEMSLHAVFYGPPGTGKTTIARLLGKVYRCLGLLEKGQLIETDRAGLVAGFVGQTAIKVDEVVQKALDGVLFIDEAYSLSPANGGKDFGQEAIDAVLKRMEDYRERFVVIAAGYTDEMQRFINSNPGLKSRFSRYFYFDHYSPEELIQIFDIFCKNVEFTVTEPAREKLLSILTELHEERTKSFGNGRLVRNIFEKMIERQANRIANISPLTDEILCSIDEQDIPDIEDITV